MSSKGSSTPAVQTSISKVQLPQWVEDASRENYMRASVVADNLAEPYSGNVVAGFTPTQQEAWNLARQSINTAQPYYDSANGILTSAGSYSPTTVSAQQVDTNSLPLVSASTVTPQTFLGSDISAYMNPYTEQVISGAMSDLDRQRLASLNTTAGAATAAGAFGGSRQAIQEGVTNAETARAAGQLSAQLRSDAYNNATGLLGQDITNNLTAQTANQQAGLTAGTTNLQALLSALQGNQSADLTAQTSNQTAGLNANQQAILAATQQAALGQQAQTSALQGAGVLESIGQQQQQYEQNLLSQQEAQYNAQRQDDIDRLNIRLQALGMSPYGQTTSTTSTNNNTQSGNSALGALGGAATGASISSALGLTAGSTGSYGLAGLGALLGLLSDKHDKTDIEKLGKDPGTGLDLYAYRYKGDPKSYPKVVGPMAQDVGKKFPGSTKHVGGHLTIKPNFLSKAA